MNFNILDLLLPREIKFFKYMNDQVDLFSEGCTVFRTFLSRLKQLSDEEIHSEVSKIKDLELKGDAIERMIIDQLDRTFLTPLDREDIHSIAVGLDNSLDRINNLAQKIEIFQIKDAPPAVMNFANLIVDMSIEMKKLIFNLEGKKDITIIVSKIHTLETEADFLFHTAMADLINSKNNLVYMIKFKDLYENLEDLINSIDRIAKLIRGIVVKRG
ncbi:DUF47 family protein [bacterium]|nr:DUF47 family protein [bacterium]